MRITRTTVIGAAAAIALAAGGGAAYAVARTSDSPRADREAFLDDVAGRLGVSSADLKKALRDAAKARGFPGPPGFGPHGGQGPRQAFREALAATQEYLGVTPAELIAELRAGKSLAQVAEEHGKSVAGLEQAIRDAVEQRLGDAVDAGWLAEAQKQQLLDRLDTIVPDLVRRARTPHGSDT